MSYQVHNFQTGEVIEAAPVNEMDLQIQQNEQELATKVSSVAYDTGNKKITETINGTTSDVVTVSKIKTDMNLEKSDVGLSNVDNTSDLNKPVSTATQTELNKKVNRGTFTWGDLYNATT